MDVELKSKIIDYGRQYGKTNYLDKHLNEDLKLFFNLKKKLIIQNENFDKQLIINQLITLNNLFDIDGILIILELLLDKDNQIEIINSFLLFLFDKKIIGYVYDKELLYQLQQDINFKKYKNTIL